MIDQTYYDYDHQAWVQGGKYVRCGHDDTMRCNCYGRLHEGDTADTFTLRVYGQRIATK
jgi:hypothetical protein